MARSISSRFLAEVTQAQFVFSPGVIRTATATKARAREQASQRSALVSGRMRATVANETAHPNTR